MILQSESTRPFHQVRRSANASMAPGRFVPMSDISSMSFDETKRYIDSRRSSTFFRMNAMNILTTSFDQQSSSHVPIQTSRLVPYNPRDYMLYTPETNVLTSRGAPLPTHRESRLNNYEDLLALDDNNVKRGVSTARRNKLPLRQPRRAETHKECNICKDEFGSTKICELPCKHIYHAECITPWLKQHRTCPVCRHEVES